MKQRDICFLEVDRGFGIHAIVSLLVLFVSIAEEDYFSV